MPAFGVPEMAVGTSLARRFKGLQVGDTLCCGLRSWRIVGLMDAGNTAFSSEIWADADQIMQAFRRPVYSSLVFKLSDPAAFDGVKATIEGDPRLTLQAKRETRFYLDQSEMMAMFLRVLGISLTVIFSLGAMIGAMITMYAAVANRTAEIGTLRALGF
jgi:ABC-type lipoprotein release transport system permease subunit